MIKVTLLGAGSFFTQPLLTDILSIEGLNAGVIGLVDIDPERLDLSARLMRRVLEQMNKTGWRVEASTDRRKVLKGTDYLINSIEVSGMKCVRYDNDIPHKYGIDQTIGDTIGPGGVMKALRTLPRFLEILDDAGRLCPQALILNYTNPMSMLTLAGTRFTRQPLVGLCHSVQGSSKQLASYAGVPYDELVWKCGGINHMAWFTELKWKGQDVYPLLKALLDTGRLGPEDRVRFETMRQLGFFMSESSPHFSEYVPYFRKRKDLIETFVPGSTGAYARNWPVSRKSCDKLRREYLSGRRAVPLERSHEYASYIIEGHALDRMKVIHASVPNTGLIPNLPQTGVVEVAVLVDRRGFRPTYFGNLPEPCAALCRSNMAVYELCAQGVLSRDREAVIHAMMLDPLSAAVCSLGEIRQMAEELFRAERDYIPAWCAKPPAAKPFKLPKHPPFLLDTFHIIGPFANANKQGLPLGLTQKLPPEERIDLKARYAGKGGKRIAWKRVGLKDITWQGYVDFLRLLGNVENAAAYAYTVLEASRAMDVTLTAGSDDGLAVWVNGAEAYRHEAMRGSSPGQDTIPIQLRRGRNELLVKVDQKGGDWGLYLDLKERPKGLRVRG